MTTSRTDFNKTWLMEAPEGQGSFETFDALEYNIRDRLKSGSAAIALDGKDLFKIDGQQVKYYWYEHDGRILLGAELSVRPQGLVVNRVGKSPMKGHTRPHASDLYLAILKDNDQSLLFSDTQMSDDGLSLWKRLVTNGYPVSVYDRAAPGKSFKTFTDPSELDEFFKDDDRDYRRYQYVLSSPGDVLAETRSHFNTRRYRELSGLALDD